MLYIKFLDSFTEHEMYYIQLKLYGKMIGKQ